MPDFSWEDLALQEGYSVVAGIDEAGRGPLAGPVTAAAVVLPRPFECPRLDDSKKLSELRRLEVYEFLTNCAGVWWAVGEASVEEIHKLNILYASHLAMRRALAALPLAVEIALIDGKPVPDFPIPHRGIVGGDGLSLSIAAASVIAKVTRDRQMTALAELYPAYGFEKHKGYGTEFHLAQLHRHGLCPIHRQGFRPVAEHARGAAPRTTGHAAGAADAP